jgi:hypothetical protein
MVTAYWATVASWAASLLLAGAGLSLFLVHSRRVTVDQNSVKHDQVLQFNRSLQIRLQSRLEEARQVIAREEALKRRSEIAAAAVKFAEFIIGATLASSFIEQFVSRNTVGTLGLLVLVASLIRHGYRPDASARAAAVRLIRLRSLVREVEDKLPSLSNSTEDIVLSEFIARLSAGL